MVTIQEEITTQEKIIIYERAKEIFYSGKLRWNEKYNIIFSNEIAGKLNLDYNDPDGSYEEDVRAFMIAFDYEISKESTY